MQSGGSRGTALSWRSVFEDEPVFACLALALAAAALAFVFAGFFDLRTVLGENIWVKPAKFAIALSIYLATLAVYARWLPGPLRRHAAYRVYALIVAAAVIAEMVWIAGAAAAGTRSHFNGETEFLAFIYPVMGGLAILLTSAALFYAIQIAFNSKTGLPGAVRLGLSGGLVLTFVSTVLVAGYLSSNGGHYVGVPSSADARLLIMGWSREVGDLRVAHFFAAHVMHAGPLAGLALSAVLPARWAIMATSLALCAYASLIAFTFVQARAGLSFLAQFG